MKLELDLRLVTQNLLPVLSNLHDRFGGSRISNPETNLVGLRSDGYDAPVDQVVFVVERFSNQRHQCVQPKAIAFLHSVCIFQTDDPAAARLVCRVLPHGLDTTLEERVVATVAKFARILNVVQRRPKVLNCIERVHLDLVEFPLNCLVVLEVPQGPTVL